MNRAWVFLLVALFGSLGSAADKTTQSQASCGPVAIEARMDNPPPWVVDPSDSPSSKVSITLKNASLQGIVAFQITVHGRRAEIVKTLSLDSKVAAMQDTSVDVLVPGLRSIAYMQLASVSYADGSQWNFSGDKTCLVIPLSLLGDGR
jgi:hypothetical protein